jgi:hypothetical protein
MPIEIRELTIKVNVNNDQNAAAAPFVGASSGDSDGKEEVVREAVEEVLRIMDSKKER